MKAMKLDVANPDITPTLALSIVYDAKGNRTNFHPYGTTETYAINNLNPYSSRNSNSASYDVNGNRTQGFDGSTYQYDAQNRLLTASKNGVTMSFAYDGLNRQVKRLVTGGPNPGTFFSVYDGWDLVQEYHMSGNTVVEDTSYLYGPTGLVKNLKSGNYYYQDASGSTSHLASSSGTLLEWYRYDLQGTPYVNGDQNNHASAYGVRHLFTGQQWYSDVGLYDLRNRFYSPDIGRFLQPDPIGFWSDRSSLYRYCHSNPLKWRDPSGLGIIMAGGATWGPGDDYNFGEYWDLSTNEEFPNDWTGEWEGSVGENGIGEADRVGVVGGSDFGDSDFGGGFISGEGGGGPRSNDFAGAFDGGPGGGGGPGETGLYPRDTADNGNGPSRAPAGVPGGIPGGNPLQRRLGDVFDYGSDSLLGQMVHYNNLHRAQAQSMIQFANGLDIGATVYVGGTLGPAAVWAGGMIFYDLAGSIPTALPAGAKYVVVATYGGVVIPTSSLTINNPAVHALLEEAIEEPWVREIIEQPW